VKYRLDFSRLPRDPDEILEEAEVRTNVESLHGPENDLTHLKKTLHDFMTPQTPGHILDTLIIFDDPEQNIETMMERHVLPTFPEAKGHTLNVIQEEIV